MKPVASLILIMLIALSAFSQRCFISQDERIRPIIYQGIDNYLNAEIENHPCKSVWLTSTKGTITKMDDCRFQIYSDETGTALIKIYLIGKKDTLFVDSAFFSVRQIPAPVVKIAGKKSGTINKSVLKAQSAIIPYMENLDITVFPKILHFTIIVIRNEQLICAKHSSSNRLTDEMKKCLELLETGDKVFFVDIACKWPPQENGGEALLNSIELTIE